MEISIKRFIYIILPLVATVCIWSGNISLATLATNPQDKFTRIVTERINFFLIYPQQAREKGQEGVVYVTFKIDAQGMVENLKIAQTSGYPLLDRAALWAVKNAVPLPSPLSFYFDKEESSLTLPLAFKLRAQGAKMKKEPDTPIPMVELPLLLPEDGEEQHLKEAVLLDEKSIRRGSDVQEKEKLSPQEKMRIKYIGRIQSIVDFYTFYPEELQKENIEAQTIVHTTIGSNGRVRDTKIAKSSGFPVLDRAALFILDAAQPFPPPFELAKEEVTIALPVSFSPMKTDEPEPEPIEFPQQGIPAEDAPRTRTVLLAEIAGDLQVLFDIAKQNSYPLKVAENQITLAKSKVREALRNMFPSVSLEYSHTEGETIAESHESRSYGVRGQHILWDNAQRRNTLQKEKLNVKVSQDNYTKIEQQILYDTARAYYQYQKERQSLAILEKYKKRFDVYFDIGNSLEQGQLITKIEALKIQNFYQRLETEILAQDNLYQLSLTNLKKVLGMDHTDPLPPLRDVEFRQTYTFDQPINEVIDLGLAKRPEIAIWDQSVQATELGLKATKAESKPKIIVDGFWGQSGEAFGPQSLDLGTNWAITSRMVWLFGESSMEASYTTEKSIPTDFSQVSNKTEANTMGFKLNILDKFRYSTEVAEGEVAVQQVRDEFTKLKRDIAWEIKEAYLTYSETLRRIVSIRKEIETIGKELELKKQLFKLGEADLSDVMEVETKKLTDELSLVKTGTTLYLSLITLDKATGFHLNILEDL